METQVECYFVPVVYWWVWLTSLWDKMSACKEHHPHLEESLHGVYSREPRSLCQVNSSLSVPGTESSEEGRIAPRKGNGDRVENGVGRIETKRTGMIETN